MRPRLVAGWRVRDGPSTVRASAHDDKAWMHSDVDIFDMTHFKSRRSKSCEFRRRTGGAVRPAGRGLPPGGLRLALGQGRCGSPRVVAAPSRSGGLQGREWVLAAFARVYALFTLNVRAASGSLRAGERRADHDPGETCGPGSSGAPMRAGGRKLAVCIMISNDINPHSSVLLKQWGEIGFVLQNRCATAGQRGPGGSAFLRVVQ